MKLVDIQLEVSFLNSEFDFEQSTESYSEFELEQIWGSLLEL